MPVDLFKPGDAATLKWVNRDRVAPARMNRLRGKGVGPWTAFLNGRGLAQAGSKCNEFLEDRDTLQPMAQPYVVQLMVLYAEQLRADGRDPVTYMQALRNDFEDSGRDTTYFEARILREARKRYMRYDGRTAAQRRMGREKQAVTEEMIVAAVERYFPATLDLRVAPTDLHDGAIAMAGAMLSFNWALRPCHIASNVSQPQAERWSNQTNDLAEEAGRPADEDLIEKLMAGHTLLAEDVFIGYVDPFEGDTEQWYPADEWCRRDGDVERYQADRIMLQVLTNKSDQTGMHPLRRFAFAKASTGEGHLVRMVVEVARAARYASGQDQFLSRVSTRRPTERVNLRSRAVSTLAKRMAETAGLPPELFSAKSFKIGGITAIKAAGVSAEDTATGMGHRTVNASNQYVRSLLDGTTGALGLSNRAGGYSMESLRRNTVAIGSSLASHNADGVSEMTDACTGQKVARRGGDDDTSAGATWEEQDTRQTQRRRVDLTAMEAPERRSREERAERVPPLETVIARHEVVGEMLHRGLRREFGDEYEIALRDGLPTPYGSSDGEDHKRPDGTSSEDALAQFIARALRNGGVQYDTIGGRQGSAAVPLGDTAEALRVIAPGGDGRGWDAASGSTGGAPRRPERAGVPGAHDEPSEQRATQTGAANTLQMSASGGTGVMGDLDADMGPDRPDDGEEHNTTGTTARRPARGGARAARQSGRGSRGTGRR
jgi:hypothetical protein